MTKRVLVTGGAGFIGSHLVEECLSRGWHVTVVDNLCSGKHEFLHKDVYWYPISITSDDFPRLNGRSFDWIFHLAAEPYIPYSYKAPRLFCDTNIIGTLNVLQSADRMEVERVMVVSTSEVYGKVPDNTFITEEWPLNPISTYAVTKLAAERLAIARYHEAGIPVIVFRPFNCYGPRATQEYVIPEIIAQAHRGDTIKLGNIDSVRDFSYVTDTTYMMCEAMLNCTLGGVYHYGSDRYISIKSIVETVRLMMDKPGLTIETDESRLRPVDVTWLWANSGKLRSVCPSFEYHHFVTGMRKTIDWFLKNGARWPYEQSGEA